MHLYNYAHLSGELTASVLGMSSIIYIYIYDIYIYINYIYIYYIINL